MKNTVEEFEEGRLIAWRHMGRHRWRYELEPTEGGTTVTETFDTTTVPALFRPITKLAGKKNPQNMEATLDRLAKHFEAHQKLGPEAPLTAHNPHFGCLRPPPPTPTV